MKLPYLVHYSGWNNNMCYLPGIVWRHYPTHLKPWSGRRNVLSIDVLRGFKKIVGLQRFAGAVCSTLAFFIVLSIIRVILSCFAYISTKVILSADKPCMYLSNSRGLWGMLGLSNWWRNSEMSHSFRQVFRNHLTWMLCFEVRSILMLSAYTTKGKERPVDLVSIFVRWVALFFKDGAVPGAVGLLCRDKLPQVLSLTLFKICVCSLVGACGGAWEYNLLLVKTTWGSHLTWEPVFL